MKALCPKIVHVLGSLRYGGVEVLTTGLLPRLKTRGIDVEVVVLSNKTPLGNLLAQQGIRVKDLRHRGGTIYRLDRWAPTAWRLRRYLEAKSPSIIHSQLYMPDLITRLVAPKGTKIVTTVHQWEPWWEERRRLRSRLKTYLDVTLARWRDVRLIVVSQDTANATARTFGVKPERLRLIYNGIDFSRFPFPSQRSLPKDSSAPVIIQVGRMYYQKGHAVALQAFALIRQEFPKASLVFVGDGPLRNKLESRTRVLGIQSNVRFLGHVDEVVPFLCSSDLFWMPSHYEGFGIACAEAMACGLPTVTTNVLGLREVPVDGVTGFVVPPDNPEALAQASLRILKDPELAQRMRQAGRARAEQFSIEKTADEYGRAYEDLLSGKW